MRLPFLILLTVFSAQAWSHGLASTQTCSSEKFNYIQRYQVDASDVHFARLKHFFIDQSSNVRVCLDDSNHQFDLVTGFCIKKCRETWGTSLEHRPLSPEDFGLSDGVTLTNMYFAPSCKGVFAIKSE